MFIVQWEYNWDFSMTFYAIWKGEDGRTAHSFRRHGTAWAALAEASFEALHPDNIPF